MKRNKFSLSYSKLLSCDMGELIPVGLMEVLPGDTIQQATSMLIRCSPLLAPVMHRVDVRIHHWYVPNRLVWVDWEDFITGGPDGLNASVWPNRVINPGAGSLSDYFGIPPAVASTVSVLPHRAYSLIWNEWYRDQDLQTELVVSTASGVDSTTNITIQNCCWEKDYFTSARPFEQKGPAVNIPLGISAPVGVLTGPTFVTDFKQAETAPAVGTGGNPIRRLDNDANYSTGQGMFADLQAASTITVNRLRDAMALQRFEEARARYGSRYTEYLRYLGIRSSDGRLQRPEYLGGGKQVIQFSEVLQTAEGTKPVGTMRGHGITGVRSNRYRRFFEEHGLVLSLLSVRPKTIYGNGLPRIFHRQNKETYWQKELEHLGQQEVLNKEVYAGHSAPNGVFGFQDQYDEYRRMESTIAGDFRSSTLDFWHMARIFASDPALNASFVSCVPTERSFAVPSEDVLYIMANHSIQARRLMAKTGTSFGL